MAKANSKIESQDVGELPKLFSVKVSRQSKPGSVAGAIAGMIRGGGAVDVLAVGSAAVYTAVKAIGLATEYLAPENKTVTAAVALERLDGASAVRVKFVIRWW